MSEDTYQALCTAIADHIAEEQGIDIFPAHWVLACGLDSFTGYDTANTYIRVEVSPRTPGYTVSGLLSQSANLYSVIDYDGID
jgi:hypothetical protein